ncbi:MAG TPA: hypothetical protein DEP23_00130 [Ruminococcaceae bacterium]|nr:hypothetical protein [Oscillospiraceae bacterium]
MVGIEPQYDRRQRGCFLFRKLCKDWGVRICCTWDNFNDYLKELGDEAYENAAMLNEDEDMGMGMNL